MGTTHESVKRRASEPYYNWDRHSFIFLIFFIGMFISYSDVFVTDRCYTTFSATNCISGGSASCESSGMLFFHFAAANHPTYTVEKKLKIRDKIVEMFYHGYDSYMKYAYPFDELKPLTCKGHNVIGGGVSLTLVDTLDMLALIGDEKEFLQSVQRITRDLYFNTASSKEVSVFELTIRVIGGLISAHTLAIEITDKMQKRNGGSDFALLSEEDRLLYTYNGSLLAKCVDIADRLMPAFNTPTGIPVDKIDLVTSIRRGKGANCPAGASLQMEFGALSVLTGNCTYVVVAMRAMEAVWRHRGAQGLVGSEINVTNGVWINLESSIGANIDSFYEYMMKSHIYFGEDKFLKMWNEAYKAVQKHTYFGGWYLTSSVFSFGPMYLNHAFNSLSAFWPGLLSMAGDTKNGLDSYAKMNCVLDQLGSFPEYLSIQSFIANEMPSLGWGNQYPLRPEFIESTFYLYRATKEEIFLEIGEKFIRMLERTKQDCGYAAVNDIYSFKFEDGMESFFLSETFKYLYMLYTPTKIEIEEENRERARLRDARVHKHTNSRKSADVLSDSDFLRDTEPLSFSPPIYDPDDGYIFTTEAHPLKVTPESQGILQKCDETRRMFKLPLNDWSLISENSRRSNPPSDYTVQGSSDYFSDIRKMCKTIDYMEDIAPYLKKNFYFDINPCFEPLRSEFSYNASFINQIAGQLKFVRWKKDN